MYSDRRLSRTRFGRLLSIADGDVLATVRSFLAAWWNRIGLQAMLAPVEMPDQSEVMVQVVKDPADLANVNPFAPVMHSNTASIINTFVENHPGALVAAMLRPCELRTAVELHKRQQVAARRPRTTTLFGNLIMIGIDCLGTLSEADYAKHCDETGTDEITHAAFVHTANGQTILDARPACQICDIPAPHAADMTVALIGTHIDQNLLIVVPDEYTCMHLSLEDVTDGQADEQQLLERDLNIKTIIGQRAAVRNQLIAGVSRPIADLGNLMAWCACCTLCTDCLDACPLYDGELAGALGVGSDYERRRPILSELVGVARWLTSCSGCGMCHEACERGVPVMQLVASLSHHIQKDLNYIPGDPELPLPWTRSDS